MPFIKNSDYSLLFINYLNNFEPVWFDKLQFRFKLNILKCFRFSVMYIIIGWVQFCLSQDCKLVLWPNTVFRSVSIFKLEHYKVFGSIKKKYDGHKTLLVWKLYFRILFSSYHWLSIYSTKLALLINKSIAWEYLK